MMLTHNRWFEKGILLAYLMAIAIADSFSGGINSIDISSKSTPTTPDRIDTLINYWPMNNLSDVKGKNDLYNGSNYSFTYDRFCNPNSAIYFNNGYLQVPPGVYFSGDLTLTAWINLRSYQSYSRIIDFGNGKNLDNFVLYFQNIIPKLSAYVPSIWIESSVLIDLNQWYHVAFVLSGKNGSIYINGILSANGALNVLKNVTRLYNYIGKSNWDDSNADAVYDDLKIYNESLSTDLILNDFTTSLYTNEDEYFNAYQGPGYCEIKATSTQTTKPTPSTSLIKTSIKTSAETTLSETSTSPSKKIIKTTTETSTCVSSNSTTTNTVTDLNTTNLEELFVAKSLDALRQLHSPDSLPIIIDILQTSYDASVCLLNCSNNGLCDFMDGNFVCICTQNYTGKGCEKDRRLCSVKFQCTWESTCIDIINGTSYDYECKCQYPFYGRHCEMKKNVCENTTCSKQGICYPSLNLTLPECSCFPGFSGVGCEILSVGIKRSKVVTNIAVGVSIAIFICFFLFVIFMDVNRYWAIMIDFTFERPNLFN